jgi:FkbM family methyltransferase
MKIKKIKGFLQKFFTQLKRPIKCNLNQLRRLKLDKRNIRLLKYYDDETNNDRWIVDILKGREKGFFIEAGALEGTIGSSTYTLEKYFGWKGILIEPNNSFRNLLKKNRPKSIIISKILSDIKGVEKFIILPNLSGYSCTKESFLKNQEKIIRGNGGKKKFPFIEKTIDSIPLKDLLEESNCPQVIDYLGLDIEGSEFKVLKNFPFDKFKIKCISIEGDSCDKLLISKGYKKVLNKYNKKAPWESYFIYDQPY